MPGPSARPSVSVIVPSRHEAENVRPLHHQLSAALQGRDWELVYVDDSDDHTPDEISALAAEDSRVRLVHRPRGERAGGLGGAVMVGVAAAGGGVLVVMDADLQHPPAAVPRLLDAQQSAGADVVVGSRYVQGGSTGGLAGPYRLAVSKGCRAFAQLALPATRRTTDPLGGLFAVRREVVEDVVLRPDGYKILLEILARGRWSTVVDVPYDFQPRAAGASKSSLAEGRRFMRHVRSLRAVSRPAPVALPTKDDSLRVLVLTSEAPPVVSGISTTVANLHDGLVARGHDVDVVSRADFPRYIREEIRVSAFAAFWPRFRRQLLPYDVVNVHGPVPTISEIFLLLSRTLHKAHRPAIVYTHHSDLAIPRLERWCNVYNRLTGRLAHLADWVVVTSQGYQEQLARPDGVPVEVVPWGIKFDQPAQPAVPRQGGTPLRVLFVGQLRPYKGVHVLLEAVSTLPDCVVTVVGDGPLRGELETQAAGVGGGRVTFRGRVSDEELQAAYTSHDVICLPSTTTAEAFGLVLGEGMSAGCVPVASDLPGVREVAGPTGCLVEPGSVSSLRAALAALAADRGRLSALSTASIERSGTMTVSAMADRYDDVFRRALTASVREQATLALPRPWDEPKRLLDEVAGAIGVERVSLSLLPVEPRQTMARVWARDGSARKLEAPVARYVANAFEPVLLDGSGRVPPGLQRLLLRPELASSILVPVQRSLRCVSVMGVSTLATDGRRLGEAELGQAVSVLSGAPALR